MRRTPPIAACAAAASLALAAAAAAAAPPRPVAASFDKGAVFAVAGYAGEETLSGFPVLVRIADNDPLGFFYADLRSPTNGDDLAFVDMDGNGLPFEIDTWNTNGASLVWVGLPSMTNGAQFAMCWGSDASGRTVCAATPFAGYAGVWHMSEASGTVADSSGHSLAAAPAGAAAQTASVAVSGPVGNGRQCGASTAAADCSYLSVPSYDSLDVGATFAVSGWVSVSSLQDSGTFDARLFSRKANYQDANGWEVIWKKGNDLCVRGASSDNIAHYAPTPKFNGGGWRHVFVVYDGRTATVYENGARKASATAGAAATDNGRTLSIGCYSGEASSFLVGAVDECRLLDALPSADWAKAEYDSMADAAFLTAGAAERYEETPAPAVGLSVPAVGYTNATVAASVSSLGTGAESADVLVQLAATADFAAPFWSTNYAVSATESRRFAIAGLATNATFYARIVATNGLGVGADPVAISFETLAPGPPAGAAELGERGFTALAATVSPISAGIGAAWATMRLEASSTSDFADAVAGPETNAVPGVAAALAVAGLDPAATYFLRARLANDWGLETFLPLGEASTRDVPIDGDGPGWTFSADSATVSFSFDVSAVYDGATCTAVLLYDGRALDERTFSATGTLVWAAVPAATVPTTASVVVRSAVGGIEYARAWTTSRAVAPDGFALYVDSAAAEGGDGFRPEAPVRTIPEALALAEAGSTIWVRGGEGRVYTVSNELGAMTIPAALEGLSIRGWDGAPEIAVAEDYALNAGPAPVVSNEAAHVTIAGLRFSFTKDSLGRKGAKNCHLVRNHGAFLTLSGCDVRLDGDLPDNNDSRSLADALVNCDAVQATNMLVEGCSFVNLRFASRDRDCVLFRIRDNARFVGNVFSNVVTVLGGIQLEGNRCTGPFSFVSNVVHQAGGGDHRGVFSAGYAGPSGHVEVTYNRFVNDDGPPRGSIFRKGREGFANGPVFHHNTVVGFREFIFAESIQYNASLLAASIFDNIFVLATDATNIVENATWKINGDGNPKPTMFKAGSFYRNNALLTGAFNGGTAAALQIEGWTYNLLAGLAIDDTFVLEGTTVPAGAAIPAPMPEFVSADTFSPDFYRPKATRQEGAFNYGKVGWTGEDGEYPEYLGALPPLYPPATMMILR